MNVLQAGRVCFGWWGGKGWWWRERASGRGRDLPDHWHGHPAGRACVFWLV